MNNEETVENLENLTNDELAVRVSEAEAEDADTDPSESKTDWESKARQAENRASMLQRLLNKKDKTVTKTNQPSIGEDTIKDIQEIKFLRKRDTFAEENNLTKAQAEKVLTLYPNATAETLKDPFIAEGIKAIARKERVDEATPGAGKISTVNGKTFTQMTEEERSVNWIKMVS